MKHYPPEWFDPPPAKRRPRPFGFVEWLIIGLVTVAAVATTVAICGG
jgi:hypothetical protein